MNDQELSSLEDDSLEDLVLQAEAERRQALLAGDVDTLRRLVRLDALFVHASGHVATGEKWLNDLANGEFSYDAISVSDARIALAATTAVVSSAQESAIRFAGQLHHSRTRNNAVWVADGDRLQLIAFQTTHVDKSFDRD